MYKSTFVQSVIRSAVFAVVVGLIVSCGGRSDIMQTLTRTTNPVVRLVNHADPTMVPIPAGISGKLPFIAGFLQSGQQGSQLQQSFVGQGPCLNVPMPATGYIPIQLPFSNNIGGSFGQGTIANCGGVFSQIGGGVDQISGKTLSNPGIPMFQSGTLTTLVVTGGTVNQTSIKCSDLTTTVAVKNGDLVQPYFVIASNSVVLGIGTTQLPFTCNLNVPPGDQVQFLFAQFAKI